MIWTTPLSNRRLRTVLASAIALSAAALVWIGYRAVVEWQHAAALVAGRRAEAAVEMLVSALSRDMRGVHTSVLGSVERDGAMPTGADLLHPIAGAFARYPYAETFFSWHSAPGEGVLFYSRAERRPAWLAAPSRQALYPVATGVEPRVAADLIDRITIDTKQGRRFSAFTLKIEGAPYQVVAIVKYADETRGQPAAIVGCLVNLEWARGHYYAELTEQVAEIEGPDRSVRFRITDEQGRAVVDGGGTRNGVPAGTRTFPVAFFDPIVVAADPPDDLQLVWWTAVATAQDDPTLAAAASGARRTLGIAAVMTLTLAIALIVSLQAARAGANLASMRAEFVSAVTHELKTPVANMRALSETLASGRTTPEMIREYGQMGIGEANRLTRLVDNLLAYSRVADVADVYSFESVAVSSAVQRSLQEFATNLSNGRFAVTVDVPDDLPMVRADPNALGLLLNNLIDNAIRYSGENRSLTIRARRNGDAVTIDVEDRGVGIPSDELERVTRKFFRGRTSVAGGSGLGLAIVDRIVSDHGGRLSITSVEGRGTTVSITIPAVRS